MAQSKPIGESPPYLIKKLEELIRIRMQMIKGKILFEVFDVRSKDPIFKTELSKVGEGIFVSPVKEVSSVSNSLQKDFEKDQSLTSVAKITTIIFNGQMISFVDDKIKQKLR